MIGVYPTQFAFMSPIPHFIFLVTCRQLFGAVVAYQIHLMLSPKPETQIPCYRPSCFLRWILSKKFWVPLATISYSFYVFHLVWIFFTQKYCPWFTLDWVPDDDIYACKWWFFKGGIFYYLGTAVQSFILSVLNSVFIYVFVEKPFIDARRVFKNKYAVQAKSKNIELEEKIKVD